MSGPTPNSYPPIFTWATAETSYPAGGSPWSSQPVLVAPAGDIFTPNVKPPAQNMNYVLNKMTGGPVGGAPGNDVGILQACALVQAKAWAVGALSSGLTGGTNPPTAVDCVAYDPVNDFIVAGLRQTASPNAFGFGLAARGDALDPIGQGQPNITYSLGSIGLVTAVLKDPTDAGTYYIAGITTSNGAVAYRFNVLTASTAQLVNYGGTNTDVKLAFINNHLLVAVAQSGTPANSSITSFPNPQTATSASALTPFIVTATSFLAGTSPSQLIFLGTEASGIPTETTTSDGVAFTIQPSGFSGQITSGMAAEPFGISWGSDASGPAWFLGFTRTDTNKASWLRSGDGVTWTTTTGLLSTANWSFLRITTGIVQPQMVSMGGLLVAVAFDPNSNLRLLHSLDGAKTWFTLPFRVAPGTGTPCLAAGPDRLVLSVSPATTGVRFWVSGAQGVSTVQAS